MENLQQKLEALMEWAEGHGGSWITVVRLSVLRFGMMRGTEAAASLAYYALFSLFPLTLFMAALLSSVVASDVAYWQAIAVVRTVFPFSTDVVEQNLRAVIDQRGTVGLIGLFGLLWAASGFFNTLARNINLAWPKVKLPGFVHNRLIALSMVGALVLLLLLSLLSSTLINVLPYVLHRAGGYDAVLKSQAWLAVLQLIPGLFTFLLFVAMYRWVPNKTVRWKAVLIGALVVSVAWELAKLSFGLYLSSGLARYQFIYGSLATLIALLVWIYFSNLIALFGAYLVATLDLRLEQENPAPVYKHQAEPGIPKGIHG